MHDHIAIPNYPDVIWAFAYRGMKIEITTCLHHDQKVYSAWVTHATGSAVAVPRADSREMVIARAKKWIHTQFDWSDRSKISAYSFLGVINLSKAATEQRLSASIQGRP